jgi:F0F1-type ATP synthase assembly protein I
MSQQNQPNPYLKYGNMAIQMAVIIGLAVWGGQKLDAHFGNTTPIYTIVLSLVGIFASLYLIIKDLIQPKK